MSIQREFSRGAIPVQRDGLRQRPVESRQLQPRGRKAALPALPLPRADNLQLSFEVTPAAQYKSLFLRIVRGRQGQRFKLNGTDRNPGQGGIQAKTPRGIGPIPALDGGRVDSGTPPCHTPGLPGQRELASVPGSGQRQLQPAAGARQPSTQVLDREIEPAAGSALTGRAQRQLRAIDLGLQRAVRGNPAAPQSGESRGSGGQPIHRAAQLHIGQRHLPVTIARKARAVDLSRQPPARELADRGQLNAGGAQLQRPAYAIGEVEPAAGRGLAGRGGIDQGQCIDVEHTCRVSAGSLHSQRRVPEAVEGPGQGKLLRPQGPIHDQLGGRRQAYSG